jgi:hypothetical protein
VRYLCGEETVGAARAEPPPEAVSDGLNLGSVPVSCLFSSCDAPRAHRRDSARKCIYLIAVNQITFLLCPTTWGEMPKGDEIRLLGPFRLDLVGTSCACPPGLDCVF